MSKYTNVSESHFTRQLSNMVPPKILMVPQVVLACFLAKYTQSIKAKFLHLDVALKAKTNQPTNGLQGYILQ